jgi:molybdenum cofactor biosynthesis enzyme MoaA
VRRINILLVLDTLKADRFGAITRWGDFSQVMAGIEAAERVGFKINLNVTQGRERGRRFDPLCPWPRHGPDADRDNADG